MAQSQGDTETTSAGAAVAATEDQASIAGWYRIEFVDQL